MTDGNLLAAAVTAAVVAALVTWALSLVGLRLFPDFRSREQKSGEYRRDTVSAAAAVSTRLPCVVGPAMLLGLTVAVLAATLRWPDDRARLGYVLALCWAEWLLGWLDDLRKSRGVGLGERIRLLAHTAIAIAAAVAYLRLGFAGSVGFWQQVGSAIVVLIAWLYMVLSAGFSDGVDGLTSGLTFLPCLGFAFLGVVWGNYNLGLGAGAATGMAAGALLMNAPSNWTRTGKVRRRARGYVGDSGALLAGAVVAGLAISAGAVALLPLLAAGLVLEGSTVFLQTGLLTPLYRRGLHLRRYQAAPTFVPHTEFPLPFLATPVHHHLNLIGLRPLQVVTWFWTLQLCAGAFGLAAALVVSPYWRAVCWSVGFLLLVLCAGVLAGTKAVFLDVEGPLSGFAGKGPLSGFRVPSACSPPGLGESQHLATGRVPGTSLHGDRPGILPSSRPRSSPPGLGERPGEGASPLRRSGESTRPSLAIKRGLPFSLWRWPLFRLVEVLPNVPVCTAFAPSLGRRMHRYDALCSAALLAEAAGQADQAGALLRRVPAFNILLRPEAALLAAKKAAATGDLPAVLEGWRAALRPVFQEGRLDLALEQMAALSQAREDTALATALAAQIRASTAGGGHPVRWH
jgi:UDP-N-acetylmuramyl pentapeptide phosphotransferase/UDP-N-acetylglucosamine-1-phosphate transferase